MGYLLLLFFAAIIAAIIVIYLIVRLITKQPISLIVLGILWIPLLGYFLLLGISARLCDSIHPPEPLSIYHSQREEDIVILV